MQCQQVQELLSTYLDGMLMPSELEKVKEHLQKCRECNSELDFLNYVVKLVHQLPAVEPPKSFRADLMEKIIKEKNKVDNTGVHRRKFSFWRWPAITAVAAGFLLIVGLAAAGIDIPFWSTGNIKKESPVPVGQHQKEITGENRQTLDIDLKTGSSPVESKKTAESNDVVMATNINNGQKSNDTGRNSSRSSSLLMAAGNLEQPEAMFSQRLREAGTAGDAAIETGQAFSMPPAGMDQVHVEVKVRDRNQAFQEINAILTSLGGSHTGLSNGADLAVSIDGNKIENAISGIAEAGIIVNYNDLPVGNQTEIMLRKAPSTDAYQAAGEPVLVKVFLK